MSDQSARQERIARVLRSNRRSDLGTRLLVEDVSPTLRLALSSGILKARGRVYLRNMHPIRFWFGVYFHAFIFGCFALGLYALAFGGRN